MDTVDPSISDQLLRQLQDVPQLDYLISQHAEQDHSGSIPIVLEKFPQAKVVCIPKAKGMLMDLLRINEDSIVDVQDSDKIFLS